MEAFWIFLLSVGAGAVGYLITEFWMQPVLRYRDIRHAVISDLVFFANAIDATGMGDHLQRRQGDRKDSNRRHAAELRTCYYRLPSWYRLLLRKKGEDPLAASRHLMGLSNTSDYEHADRNVVGIRRALRLPDDLLK
jgi:hypothetical protein